MKLIIFSFLFFCSAYTANLHVVLAMDTQAENIGDGKVADKRALETWAKQVAGATGDVAAEDSCALQVGGSPLGKGGAHDHHHGSIHGHGHMSRARVRGAAVPSSQANRGSVPRFRLTLNQAMC